MIVLHDLAKGSFYVTILIRLWLCPFVVWSEDSWLREHAGQPEEGTQNGTEAMETNEVCIASLSLECFYVNLMNQKEHGTTANFHWWNLLREVFSLIIHSIGKKVNLDMIFCWNPSFRSIIASNLNKIMFQ